MTDENPTLPEAEAMTPAPTPAPAKAEAEEPGGYALYDLTLTRFVGGVHPTKAKAKAAASVPKGHRSEVRKV